MHGVSFFLGNSAFVLKYWVCHWPNRRFHKKNVLPGKTIQRKQLLLDKTYFHKLLLDKKISKKVSSGIKWSFVLNGCSYFFSFNLLLVQFWFMSFTAFLTRKEKVSQKGNKSKVKERQTPFCRQEFINDLTKFQKDWSNIAVVGANGRLTINLL